MKKLALLITTVLLMPAISAGPAPEDSDSISTLIVGGGTHHDFEKWFHQQDTVTLNELPGVQVSYTSDPNSIVPQLENIDVLYLSTNQPLPDRKLRENIFAFAEQGKGLLLVHPALWYNWNDWPKYNRALVGGGSRSHDQYQEFEVLLQDSNHPVAKNLPEEFRITDELYHFEKDPEGASIHVIATGRNLSSGKEYPVVWITKHPKARIVCTSLGHDGKAHKHPAFKRLLKNSLRWSAGNGK